MSQHDQHPSSPSTMNSVCKSWDPKYSLLFIPHLVCCSFTHSFTAFRSSSRICPQDGSIYKWASVLKYERPIHDLIKDSFREHVISDKLCLFDYSQQHEGDKRLWFRLMMCWEQPPSKFIITYDVPVNQTVNQVRCLILSNIESTCSVSPWIYHSLQIFWASAVCINYMQVTRRWFMLMTSKANLDLLWAQALHA